MSSYTDVLCAIRNEMLLYTVFFFPPPLPHPHFLDKVRQRLPAYVSICEQTLPTCWEQQLGPASLPSGCDEPVHLSQPPALFLAAGRLSQPNNYSAPHIKGREVKDLQVQLCFLFHFSLPVQIINNEPAAPNSWFSVPSFAKNHSEPIKTSPSENVWCQWVCKRHAVNTVKSILMQRPTPRTVNQAERRITSSNISGLSVHSSQKQR